jgi:hypothetical protein
MLEVWIVVAVGSDFSKTLKKNPKKPLKKTLKNP